MKIKKLVKKSSTDSINKKVIKPKVNITSIKTKSFSSILNEQDNENSKISKTLTTSKKIIKKTGNTKEKEISNTEKSITKTRKLRPITKIVKSPEKDSGIKLENDKIQSSECSKKIMIKIA